MFCVIAGKPQPMLRKIPRDRPVFGVLRSSLSFHEVIIYKDF